MTTNIERCPVCRKPAVTWVEQRAHNSRELVWYGCRLDGLLAGGTTDGAAIQNWNREASRHRMMKMAA